VFAVYGIVASSPARCRTCDTLQMDTSTFHRQASTLRGTIQHLLGTPAERTSSLAFNSLASDPDADA
jgi:hypothetical protein